jgi:hypothetical protein
MMKKTGIWLLFALQTSLVVSQELRVPDAPLYRDPVTDGAADPVVFWNQPEQCWWMLYTQRRANQETADVAYCYGNAIAIAESRDNGRTWAYRGTLQLDFERGHNTFWAPDIVYDNGTYHMFVVYIRGVYSQWKGEAHVAHYTSANCWDWQYEGLVNLAGRRVIDPTLIQLPDKSWRMWFKDEAAGSLTMMAKSSDLKQWSVSSEPVGKETCEGAKVFRFGDYYWMIADAWKGMRVYRSRDLDSWEMQGLILDKPGTRNEDVPIGNHGDVVVVGDRAYVFYFTHPGRINGVPVTNGENGNLPYALRRSSIQVAPLRIENGTLVCDRDTPFDFYLP